LRDKSPPLSKKNLEGKQAGEGGPPSCCAGEESWRNGVPKNLTGKEPAEKSKTSQVFFTTSKTTGYFIAGETPYFTMGEIVREKVKEAAELRGKIQREGFFLSIPD